jgi:hypothetical protein
MAESLLVALLAFMEALKAEVGARGEGCLADGFEDLDRPAKSLLLFPVVSLDCPGDFAEQLGVHVIEFLFGEAHRRGLEWGFHDAVRR